MESVTNETDTDLRIAPTARTSTWPETWTKMLPVIANFKARRGILRRQCRLLGRRQPYDV